MTKEQAAQQARNFSRQFAVQMAVVYDPSAVLAYDKNDTTKYVVCPSHSVQTLCPNGRVVQTVG